MDRLEKDQVNINYEEMYHTAAGIFKESSLTWALNSTECQCACDGELSIIVERPALTSGYPVLEACN